MDLNFFEKHVPAFLLFLLTTISIIFLTAGLNYRVQSVKSAIFYLIMPTPQRLSDLIDYGQGLGENIHVLVNAHEENIQLKKKYTALLHKEHNLFQLTAENERLREMLDFKRAQPLEMVAARIIGREPQHWFQSFLINRGRDEGIYENAPVIAIQGGVPGLIGRVLHVSKHSANVLLLTDSLSAVAVTCRRSYNDGVIEGQNTPQLMFNYIVPEADIKVGDPIVTSGVGSVFPPGLLVGHVTSITADQEGYFMQAQIAPSVDYNQLREVFCISTIEDQ
ncbi:MAG: rod shape-determining protein MreC [bacterium]